MYLSRVLLDPRDRRVRRDLANVSELHRSVMSCFADGPGRAGLSVLFRVEGEQGNDGVLLLVQSSSEPDWGGLPEGYLASPPWDGENPATRPLQEAWAALEPEQHLRFRLFANTTKRVKRDRGGSTRVGLRGDPERLAWLRRRGASSGFLADESTLRIIERPDVHGRRGRDVLTFAAAQFDGVLRISDAEAFREALRTGVGPGKAYGFGLLSVAR